MQLTGTPFLILTIILVLASIAVAMLLWGRVSGPKPVRVLSRLVMLLFCQATAVTLSFVLINNSNIIYGSWDDLLDDGSHVRAVPNPPADGAGGQAGGDAKSSAKVIQQFKSVGDPVVPSDVQTTDLKGQLSGVDGEVLVWLPPQYNDPAFKDKKFPVVELLPGFPGSSKTWFGTLNVTDQLKPLMQSGQVAPFILVSPRTLLLGDNVDTGCADVPGKVNADTWLSRDVPQMIMDNFRADPSSDRWAVAGYSAGAHCADRLALLHPNRFRAAVSMSGYNDPGQESKSLTAKMPTANPLYILQHAPQPPKVALFQSGDKGDGYEDADALAKAAKAPTTVTVLDTPGPHDKRTWHPLVPEVFKWLTGIIPVQH